MNPRRIGADFLVFSRGYTRNPVALFFSLVFPIILIGLFGLIFSVTGATTVTVYTENLDHSSASSMAFLSALNQTGAVTVKVVAPVQNESFSTWLAQEDDPVGLIVPAGFQANYTDHSPTTLVVLTDPEDAAEAGITEGAVEGVANGFNLHAANGTEILSISTMNVGSQVFVYIDYLVPGLIGFSILTSPMFAMVELTATYRKEHLFRQLSLTPLTKGEWLTSKILWYVVLTLISAAIMVAFGVGIFGAHISLVWGMIPFLVLGPFFFVSLGMLAGSVAPTPESAAVLGNIITFPMMFLAGTFFPVSSFPPELQNVAHVLPLYYIIDGLNQVMLFHNNSRALVDVVVILIASAVVFVGAVLAFKWREV
jgi:ABC-2 type transport system permease protein